MNFLISFLFTSKERQATIVRFEVDSLHRRQDIITRTTKTVHTPKWNVSFLRKFETARVNIVVHTS